MASVTLDVDEDALTIMGVHFTSPQPFRAVWYAVSTNMIEGWKPTVADIIRLRDHAAEIGME
ncbi:hypothetical protein [Alloscardovia macacae]|uniref:Uncharacterized protein n=1 Tax=Alloscardovia macacae TaxID=1160091 RepID=A0A261F055_9BIFI|nr:hypothetical protein [Alloscardovia macacae]OZG52465.1 hypothetical protein ALMA_1518 [Alloscardovia macacae]